VVRAAIISFSFYRVGVTGPGLDPGSEPEPFLGGVSMEICETGIVDVMER
jgi:hypothetical protein